MRGVACVIPGTLEIEGRKKASELISEVTGTLQGVVGVPCLSSMEVVAQPIACFLLLKRVRRYTVGLGLSSRPASLLTRSPCRRDAI